jgi:hypothetical protein
MAKKAAKARQAKKAKVAARTEAGRRTAAEKAAKKGRRARGGYVEFGLHGMKDILGRIEKAGFEKALNEKMGNKGLFVKVKEKSLTDLKKFIDSKDELKSLSIDTTRCTCPNGDHYCIYLG